MSELKLKAEKSKGDKVAKKQPTQIIKEDDQNSSKNIQQILDDTVGIYDDKQPRFFTDAETAKKLENAFLTLINEINEIAGLNPLFEQYLVVLRGIFSVIETTQAEQASSRGSSDSN